MKPKYNPFVRSASLAAIVLTLGTAAKADMFDLNGSTAGFGVTDAGTFDWHTASAWVPQASANDTGTGTGHATWVNGSRQAFFVGAGTGTTYTVRLGADGSTATTLQNFALNVNQAATGQLTGSGGSVTIGNPGDTGVLSLNAANSIGTFGGTLTVNNPINLGNNTNTNFRGGSGLIVLNGSISGTGTSGIALAASGSALGGTSGTLTLAGNNSFTGNTSVNAAYILRLQHANALGAAGGTNTVNNNGAIEVAGGVTIPSGESVILNGPASNFFGALRAGSGGGTWAGGISLGNTDVRIGALSAQTLTVTGTIANGATGTGFNVSGQVGTGIVVLNPTTSNTYTGTTGIIRGILRLGKNDALPTGTTLDVDSSGGVTDAATFDMASFSQTVAVLQDTAGSNINGRITNSVAATTSTLTVNQASNTAYDGIIQNGSGSVVLTKGGVGNLTLNGANTYTGGTNIRNGSLTLSNGNDRLATTSSVVLGDVATSGKLIIGSSITARNQTLAGLTATGLGGSVVGAHGTNNSLLTLSFASGTKTFAGTLGGGGTNENRLALTKSGAGTLVLSGDNSYLGNTIVTAGVLRISHGNALGFANSTTINGNLATGRVELTGGITTGESFNLAARQGAAANAAALSNLSGNNTVTGSIAGITGGSFMNIESQAGLLTLEGGLSQTGGEGVRTWQFMGAGNGLVSGIISNGTADLTVIKSGAGTWTFSNANSYTGNTTINVGSLRINNNEALGGTGNGTTVASGAALELLGDITVGAEALSLIGSGIASGGALRNISGTNVYDGLLTLAGATRINSDAGLLTLSNAGTITGATFGLTVAGAGDTTINSIIGTTTGTLAKVGAGTLTLTGTNTYSGATTIGNNTLNVGTVNITNSSALGTGAVSIVSNAGGGNLAALTLNSATGITVANNFTTSGEGQGGNGIIRNVTGDNEISGNFTLGSGGGSTRIHSDGGSLTLSGAIAPSTTNRALLLGGSATGTVSGAINNGSGANTLSGLTKQGDGTWEVSGGSNTFTGNTLVSGGTLKLTNNLAIQNSAFNTSGAGTLDTSTIDTPTFGGLTSATDYAISSNVTGLTLKPVSGATHTYTGNLSGGATGLTLTKTGAGTQVLGGTNSYTGDTTINAGSLRIDNSGALGGTNILVNSGSNGALVLGDALVAGSGKALTINGTGVGNVFGALSTGTGNVGTSEWQGSVSIGSNQTRIGTQSGTLLVSGNISAASATHQLLVRNNGALTTSFSGTNDYAGGTRIVIGTLEVSGGAALHDTGLVDLDGTAGVIFRVLGSETIGTLTSTNGVSPTDSRVNIGAATILSLSSGTRSYPGVIEGDGALTVNGAVQTLSGTNTYTGATSVSAGTLAVSAAGSINTTSAISVAAGAQLIYNSSTALTVSPALNGAGTSSRAVLGGTGPINAAVTLNDLGDTLAPGNSPGIQTFTPAQTWSSFSYDWELNNFITQVPGNNHDQLSLDSTLELNGGVGAYQLNVLGLTAGNLTGAVPDFTEANQQWTILTSVGAITGFDAANWTINTSGFSNNTPFGGNFTLTSDTNNVFLNYNAIPEPSAALLAALGSLMLFRRRRTA